MALRVCSIGAAVFCKFEVLYHVVEKKTDFRFSRRFQRELECIFGIKLKVVILTTDWRNCISLALAIYEKYQV